MRLKVPTLLPYKHIKHPPACKTICTLINTAFSRQPFWKKGEVRITEEQLKELIHDKQGELFLSLDENQEILGTVYIRPQKKCQAHLSMLSIHPRYQGKGYGAHLIKELEASLSSQFQTLSLDVVPTSQERLLAYYQRLGFKENGDTIPLSDKEQNQLKKEYKKELHLIRLEKSIVNK